MVLYVYSGEVQVLRTMTQPPQNVFLKLVQQSSNTLSIVHNVKLSMSYISKTMWYVLSTGDGYHTYN